VFRSPYISALGINRRGTIVGKEALRRHWTTVLDRFPDLRFDPICELYGVGSVTLHYRSGETQAAAVLELNPAGLVVRSAAHYDPAP
jgi:hypothetical protein